MVQKIEQRALFENRADAGQRLARELIHYAHRSDVLVLALPRGGVPVAFEVAKALNVPLDIFVVRKLGVPGQRELAMGAIATGGVSVLNREVVQGLQIPPGVIDRVATKELEELKRREYLYRGQRSPPDVWGQTVILVDDGLATGATMRAAVAALHEQGPARIVVAVPIAARATCVELEEEVDEIICAITPEPFYSVGLWYEDFAETSDEEVHDLLREALERQIGLAFEPAGNKTHLWR